MRYITKLHLINWLYIEYKTINLSNDINFLTGETGSGKSTIIDALQLLILGDIKGKFFNKAASDNSKRELIDYLKGMIHENSDDGKKFLRDNMDFSSYIVMEVHNTQRDDKFCLGVVFDVRKDNVFDHSFFMLDKPLPEGGFLKDNKPLSIKELKEEYGRDLRTFSTEEYKEHFLNEYMGKLNKGYYDIFKKAVAFKPPGSIEEFIARFICDDVKIDVEDMVYPIKIYKKLETEADNIENEINELQDISSVFKNYGKAEADYNKADYVCDRSSLELKHIDVLKHKESYNDANKFMEQGREKSEEYQNSLKAIDDEILDISTRIENSDESILSREISQLNNQIESCLNEKKSFDSETARFERWYRCLDYYADINEMNFNIAHMRNQISKMRKYDLSYNSFKDLNTNLDLLQKKIEEIYENKAANLNRMNAELNDRNDELKRLNKGIAYPKYIEDIKNIFEEKLSRKYSEKIAVNILADLIDVKDKQWLDAIEGYMNKQKYYLIVEPKYYQDVINIYADLDRDKYYGVGIVDIDKIREDGYKADSGSLACEIVTEDENARIYTDYLLGRVMKCDDVSSIRKYRTAITKDCFLYKGYIARRLNPDSYKKNRCIGSESRRIRIKELKEEIDNLNKQIIYDDEIRSQLSAFVKYAVYSDEDIEDIINRQKDILSLATLTRQKDKKEQQLSKIDMFYCEKLKKELADKKLARDDVDAKYKSLIKDMGKYEEVISNERDQIIYLESQYTGMADDINTKYDDEFVENIGSDFFGEELSKAGGNYNTLLTMYENKKRKLFAVKTGKFDELKKTRREYCLKYSLSWDYECDDNKKYEDKLMSLKDTKFPEYKEKIALQRKKAYEAFKNDLLSRLKDAIDKTQEQVKFINRSLSKMNFGDKKYRFLVRPKAKYREFYDMLESDFLGISLGAEVFENQYKDQINFLFDLIVNTTNNLDAGSQEQLRKQINLYTDYKTYLEFDMEQTAGGDTSDLSKTLGKNSGGETQSPFFIAVLAAFANHYRIYNRKDNDTIRIIIFDEAFSKMDEEHSKMSIRLLREIGFQALIAAPDEKIPVIGPESNEIIYVKNENKRRISVVEFSDDEIDELISGDM